MVAGSTQKAQPKVVFEKLGIKLATPGLQGIFLSPSHFFVAVLGINPFHRVCL